MADIVLATLNARYTHASVGLRYLFANLGELKDRTQLLEFTIQNHPLDIAEKIAAHDPKIVGIGVYIWNATESAELVEILKRILPDVVIVLGGPEVSHETGLQAIIDRADYVVTGEGDKSFPRLARSILAHEAVSSKIIPGEMPDLGSLELPYDYYSEEDLKHRVVYVEASRGCPFRCEFCLSSLDKGTRNIPLGRFFAAMERLLERNVLQFKFIDRTFNLDIKTSQAILRFFLERYRPGLFLHFEMIPDRLPLELRDLIAQFPAGALQFEVGIQTFDDAVSKRISRKQNVTRLEENFKYLNENTGAHIHADLIVGLPGESLEMFGKGFDQLLALKPQEIQVGILKRLRGTPIIRHDAEWEMHYSPTPPYEILRTKVLSFSDLQRMRRFAKFWDHYHNSGNFRLTVPQLWRNSSPFAEFLAFTDWSYQKLNRTHSLPLEVLARQLLEYATEVKTFDRSQFGRDLVSDYMRPGTRRLPEFLGEFVVRPFRFAPSAGDLPKRQARHSAVS